uniref:hypothetical protein n=1 Tax=uncultured Ruminococcus sp. TaxID=165186 RepID=UPI0029305DA6
MAEINHDEYHSIDTRVFDKCIQKKDEFIRRYDELYSDYDAIINQLKPNWKGTAADIFFEDAGKVRTNIGGIKDILGTMCDVLEDCRKVFGETDHSLGDFNRDP